MAVQTGRYTIEEFEEFIALPENADRLFELIQGEIVEKVPTEDHGAIAVIIGAVLYNYKLQHNISGHIGVEVRHRRPEDRRNSYLPDVTFRLTTEPRVTEGAVLQMPDVAVEIQSPDDSLKSLREKVRYYLQNGSRMVWLVLPAKRIVEVYTPDTELVLTEDDTLDGGDVLPGFTLPVKDIFAT